MPSKSLETWANSGVLALPFIANEPIGTCMVTFDQELRTLAHLDSEIPLFVAV